MTQPPLFDPADVPPVIKPRKKATPSKSKITYSTYRAKETRCDDCVQVAYEQNVQALPVPPIRTARQNRKQGNSLLHLCEAHAKLRQLDERGKR